MPRDRLVVGSSLGCGQSPLLRRVVLVVTEMVFKPMVSNKIECMHLVQSH